MTTKIEDSSDIQMPPTPTKRSRSRSTTNSPQMAKTLGKKQKADQDLEDQAAELGQSPQPDPPNRCLLSLEHHFVEFCHLVQPSREEFAKLEHAWGYESNGGFCLSKISPYNHVPLNPTYHLAFHEHSFAFLPDEDNMDLLMRYAKLKSTKAKVVTDIYGYQNMFNYTLLYLEDPVDGSLSHILRGDDDDTTIHRPPFSNFPQITSVMHPHLAVYNLGKSIRRLFGTVDRIDLPHLSGYKASMKKALYLYLMWMEKEIPLNLLEGTGDVKETRSDVDSGPSMEVSSTSEAG